MAEQKTATFRTAKRTSGEASGTFTDEEKAAAKERVKEMSHGAPRARARRTESVTCSRRSPRWTTRIA